MMEILATLAVLCAVGVGLAFLAVAGLLLVSFVKLLFFPITIALDLVKYVVMLVVVPIIVFVVVPILLLVVLPVVLLVLIPVLVGLAVIAIPFLILGAAGIGVLHAV